LCPCCRHTFHNLPDLRGLYDEARISFRPVRSLGIAGRDQRICVVSKRSRRGRRRRRLARPYRLLRQPPKWVALSSCPPSRSPRTPASSKKKTSPAISWSTSKTKRNPPTWPLAGTATPSLISTTASKAPTRRAASRILCP
jgi:hypothetical protein